MLATNNDTTTSTTSTMKSPLKCLHNEESHLGHLYNIQMKPPKKLWIFSCTCCTWCILCIDCQETNEMQLPCLPIFPIRGGVILHRPGGFRITFTCQTNEQQKILIKDVQMLHFIVRGQDQVGKLHCFLVHSITSFALGHTRG